MQKRLSFESLSLRCSPRKGEGRKNKSPLLLVRKKGGEVTLGFNTNITEGKKGKKGKKKGRVEIHLPCLAKEKGREGGHWELGWRHSRHNPVREEKRGSPKKGGKALSVRSISRIIN